MSRTFIVIPTKIFPGGESPDVSGDIETGRTYTGHNPMQAAKKIFTRIAKTSKTPECSYIFMIRETSGGKTHNKLFTYIGTKRRLDRPVDVSKGKSYFQVNHKSDIRSYKRSVPCSSDLSEPESNEPEAVVDIPDEILDKIPKEPVWYKLDVKTIPKYKKNELEI